MGNKDGMSKAKKIEGHAEGFGAEVVKDVTKHKSYGKDRDKFC